MAGDPFLGDLQGRGNKPKPTGNGNNSEKPKGGNKGNGQKPASGIKPETEPPKPPEVPEVPEVPKEPKGNNEPIPAPNPSTLTKVEENEAVTPQKGKPQRKCFSVYLDEETYDFVDKYADAYGGKSDYGAYLIKQDIAKNREKHIAEAKEIYAKKLAEIQSQLKGLAEL